MLRLALFAAAFLWCAVAGQDLSRSVDGGASRQRVCLSENGKTLCDYVAQQTSRGIVEIIVGPCAGRVRALHASGVVHPAHEGVGEAGR